MNKRKLIKDIQVACDNVRKRISENATSGFFGAGMANEGYDGGYCDALSDVTLALNDCVNWNSRYWPKPEDGEA